MDEDIKKPCQPLPMFKCDSQGNRYFCPVCGMLWLSIVTLIVVAYLNRSKIKIPTLEG